METDLIALFLLICIILILFLIHLKYWHLLKLSWQFDGPTAYAFIGNGASFFCKPQEILERVMKLSLPYQSPVRLWLGPQLIIIISDPEQLRIVMQSSKMSKKSSIYRFLVPFLGKGLFTSFGLQHKTHRRILQPLFGPKYVDGYCSILQKHANNLTDYIEKYANTSREFDVDHFVHLCGMETTMDIVLGMRNNDPLDFSCLTKFIMRFYYIFAQRVTCFWLRSDFIFRFTSFYKEEQEMMRISNKILKEVRDFKQPEIEQFLDLKYDPTKSNRNNNNFFAYENSRIPSIFESMLDVLREDPKAFTEEEVTDHLRTFIVTSQDTQGSGVAFALMMFGMFPEIQQKVYDELMEHTSKSDSTITVEMAENLKYLEMCIKETMRLFPVGPFLMRECTEDFPLGNKILPKGCEVVLAIYNVHKDPKHWQRPNDFYPEHFCSENVAKRHPFAFLPFSAGPRRCIAAQYSYLNMKIMLGKIIKKYEVFCKEKFENLQLTTDVSIRPVNGYKIMIKRRQLP